jgi:hypothetical protein
MSRISIKYLANERFPKLNVTILLRKANNLHLETANLNKKLQQNR